MLNRLKIGIIHVVKEAVKQRQMAKQGSELKKKKKEVLHRER